MWIKVVMLRVGAEKAREFDPPCFFLLIQGIYQLLASAVLQLLLLYSKAYLYGIRKLVVHEYEKSFLANT